VFLPISLDDTRSESALHASFCVLIYAPYGEPCVIHSFGRLEAVSLGHRFDEIPHAQILVDVEFDDDLPFSSPVEVGAWNVGGIIFRPRTCFVRHGCAVERCLVWGNHVVRLQPTGYLVFVRMCRRQGRGLDKGSIGGHRFQL